jgi:hypothetical protein
MTQALGSNGRLVVDFETTFGVNPSTKAGKALPFNTFDIQSKQTVKDPGTITGSRNPLAPVRGNISVDGSVVVPVDEIGTGYWLKGLFGLPATTGSADPYTHVFKVAASQPSMVMEKGFLDINQYSLVNGCRVNTYKIAFGGEDELTATIGLLGTAEVLSGTAYQASPTVISLARYTNIQATIQEGGAAIATVTKGDFTISGNLDGSQYTVNSNGLRSDIPVGVYKVTGNITALFDGAALLNKAIAGTKSSLDIKFTSGTHSLDFLFPEIVYERTTPTVSGPAGILVTLPFHAYYQNDANNSVVKVTLMNGVSTYA